MSYYNAGTLIKRSLIGFALGVLSISSLVEAGTKKFDKREYELYRTHALYRNIYDGIYGNHSARFCNYSEEGVAHLKEFLHEGFLQGDPLLGFLKLKIKCDNNPWLKEPPEVDQVDQLAIFYVSNALCRGLSWALDDEAHPGWKVLESHYKGKVESFEKNPGVKRLAIRRAEQMLRDMEARDVPYINPCILNAVIRDGSRISFKEGITFSSTVDRSVIIAASKDYLAALRKGTGLPSFDEGQLEAAIKARYGSIDQGRMARALDVLEDRGMNRHQRLLREIEHPSYARAAREKGLALSEIELAQRKKAAVERERLQRTEDFLKTEEEREVIARERHKERLMAVLAGFEMSREKKKK